MSGNIHTCGPWSAWAADMAGARVANGTAWLSTLCATFLSALAGVGCLLFNQGLSQAAYIAGWVYLVVATLIVAAQSVIYLGQCWGWWGQAHYQNLLYGIHQDYFPSPDDPEYYPLPDRRYIRRTYWEAFLASPLIWPASLVGWLLKLLGSALWPKVKQLLHSHPS